MDLFDLVAKLTLDTSEYEKGISGSKSSAEDFGNTLSTTGAKADGWGARIGKAAKIGAIAVTAVTTAVIGFGVALTKSVKSVAEYGDNVDKMSQKIGISAEAYQKWDYVMQRAGTNVDNLKMGMKTLSQQAEKGSAAFEKLGISQEEVAELSQEDLFEKTIKGLADMEAGTERTVLATELLGRAGADLAPLLNQGSEAIEEQMEIAEKYGMIMPDSAVKASAAFQDSVTTMQMTLTGLKNRMIGEFLPAFTQVTDGLALLFTGDMSGIDDIEAGIDGIMESLNNVMPKVMEAGGAILETLASSIVENLPQMATVGVDIILSIVESITNNIPQIMESAVSIIMALVTGISQALPTLIPAIVQAIITMVTTLIENVDMLVDAAIALVEGLAKGIINALPILIKNAPKIIVELVSALIKGAGKLLSAGITLMGKLASGIAKGFASIPGKVIGLAKKIPTAIKNGVGSLVSIGKNIVQGLWDGLKAKWESAVNWLKEKAANLPKAVKKVLGISSPSKVFMEVGKWIPEGLALGMEQNLKSVEDAADAMSDATAITVSSDYAGTQSAGAGAIEINIYPTAQQSALEIAQEVKRMLIKETNQRRLAWQ